MPFSQSALGRERVCIAGGSPEPFVQVEDLVKAILPDDVETLRPLLPVGYEAGVQAYQQAALELTARHLAEHYTDGQAFFQDTFVPHLKQTLESLGGDIWCLDDFVAYAAGTDVDFITHIVEAVAADRRVSLFPGDWYGFLVGCTQTANIHWTADGGGELTCLCIPSVRNGHFTEAMIEFLKSSCACLLNLNLFPTLLASDRSEICQHLLPILDRSILSISFSRGFGLTSSQLGVVLIHRDHPYRQRFHRQWAWFTNFYNALAARAFMLLDLERIRAVDERRRAWVADWFAERALPAVASGSYYVKSFQSKGDAPAYLQPLMRDGLVRLCLKPPIT